jgi:predicted DNA-binding transcriptional regulator AlpA
MRPLMTLEDVAVRCGFSYKAIWRAASRGDLPATKRLGKWRVDPDDLERWLDEGRTGSDVRESESRRRSTTARTGIVNLRARLDHGDPS